MELHNNVAIVTGAAQGIGKSIALLLAKKGASLVVCDINLEAAQTAAEEVEAQGGKCLALKADVSDFQDAEKMVEELNKQPIPKYWTHDQLVKELQF